ncbi:hypothetical protein JL720_14109 [Aureococcus anophagefferens]|nr:hypothetical protein JL720_14109 [Aureococcus anophagefferens]
MTAPCTNGAQTGARVHCIGQRCLLLAAACVIGGADALLTSPRRGPRRGAALGAKTTQTIYITDGVGDPFPIKPHKPRRAASGKKGFAAAPAAAPDGAFGKLCRWVAKKGGKSDGVAVGDVGGGLRGVVATRDFAVGDTVFSVPKAECVLSEGRDVAVAEVWRVLPAPAPHVRVALLLLYLERVERKAWAPLLDIAVATITSRAKGERTAKAQRERSSYMLVPLADLCNHRDPAGSNAAEAPRRGATSSSASRRVRAGEEIRVSYGALPNRALLAQFGFQLPLDDDDAPLLDVADARGGGRRVAVGAAPSRASRATRAAPSTAGSARGRTSRPRRRRWASTTRRSSAARSRLRDDARGGRGRRGRGRPGPAPRGALAFRIPNKAYLAAHGTPP